jgi:membrane protein YqaA with SNARE-associated domain
VDRLRDFFARLVDILEPIAEQLGTPGLALVAFLDSSFVSLPQVTDALIVTFTLKDPSQWLLHAVAATAGSVAGCLALYTVAKKGGEAFLRSRFKERHIDRGLALVQKHGWLTVTVPALMPPPTPFKVFVLLAGVARIRPMTFIGAVALGRGFRYGGEAYLTYRYGEQATGFIQDNLATVSMAFAGLIVAGGLGLVLWRRWRQPAS